MGIEEFIKMLVDNGTTVCILAYFCVRDWKFMNTLQTTLTSLNDAVRELKEINRKDD